MCDQKLNHANDQKTRSTKSNNWHHTRISVDIASAKEQKSRFEAVVTSYGRNENLDEIKNIAGQDLTNNPNKFHWLKKKTRLRMNFEWIQKTI